METRKLVLKVDAETSAEANELANLLESQLKDAVKSVQITREKEKKDTLDAGAILCVVAAINLASEIARTIQAWLKANHGAKVKVGSVEASNLSPEQVLEIVKGALVKTGKDTTPPKN